MNSNTPPGETQKGIKDAKAAAAWPIWLAAMSIALVLFLLAGMLFLVTSKGLHVFWPKKLIAFNLTNGEKALGTLAQRDEEHHRFQLKIGNRDLNGLDFKWFDDADVVGKSFPEDVYAFERMENGVFFGWLQRLESQANTPAEDLNAQFKLRWQELSEKRDILTEQEHRLSLINSEIERFRLRANAFKKQPQRFHELTAKADAKRREFESLLAEIELFRSQLRMEKIWVTDIQNRATAIDLIDIVRFHQPNQMGLFAKFLAYGVKIGELLTDNPREANMEGGLFPAIFGTTLMVLLMSCFAVPFGVIAAIYLNEYATEGILVNLVRITVNNLAGVPSIVYGIFGLGFFIYGLGSQLDVWFFAERLPQPTFGTGGLLWASLTMSLLTVPVVIVSTEEGLTAVPRNMREGALALGSTQWQALIRVVLPMASPSILTGFVLAIARAAGEVAPLMLVGVVKAAHDLPLDGNFPYLHLERKFMHLGFHIYDVGFQSPNVEAALPMVFVTTLLLLILVLGLSALAMVLRTKMRKRYATGTF
jgi:phosphate transport system permease protein